MLPATVTVLLAVEELSLVNYFALALDSPLALEQAITKVAYILEWLLLVLYNKFAIAIPYSLGKVSFVNKLAITCLKPKPMRFSFLPLTFVNMCFCLIAKNTMIALIIKGS